MNSDTNSDIQKLIPNIENYHRQLQQHIDALLDQRVAQTDMKLRHIVTKGIEVNSWMKNYYVFYYNYHSVYYFIFYISIYLVICYLL